MLIQRRLRHGIAVCSRLSHQMAASASTTTTNEESRKKRSAMFDEERRRQRDLIPRAEKIRVECKGVVPAVLMLNRRLSTPSDVALHLSEDLVERSALARVDGNVWDMDRPLEDDGCVVELLHFHVDDPFHVNRAFWRSCSFLLGAAVDAVFKDDRFVELHSFPAPNVSGGSFIYDVDLKTSDWMASKQELMAIGAAMHRMAEKALPFERLVVDADTALRMFADNGHKTRQIPSIAEKTGSVTLYRVGDHVDISGGPMVGNSSFVGRRCTVAAAHPIRRDNGVVPMHRFQGVALPKGVFLNHFAFGILEKRAAKLNATNLSSTQSVDPS